jgi:hypothetical protein
VLAEQIETLRDCVEDAISSGDIAAFFDDIIPDAAESSVRACGARRCTTLPCGVMLGGKLRPAAPFYVLSLRTHGFLGDFGAFAAINRGFRDIDSSEDFGAAPPVHPLSGR